MNFLLIFLLLTSYTNQQCGNFPPREPSQCHYYSDENNACCFLKRREANNPGFWFYLCYFIPLNTYANVLNNNTSIQIGNYNYTSIDCGASPGLSCSDTNPLTYYDCFQNSLSSNKCCYVQAPNGYTSCLYSGNNKIADYTTNTGFKIVCFNERLFISIITISIIILLYFTV